MTGAEAALVDYGALGILALLAVSAIAVIWKALRHEQSQHLATVQRFAAEIRALQESHQEQLDTLTDRMLQTQESTAEKYHTLAAAQGNLLEAMARKLEKRQP